MQGCASAHAPARPAARRTVRDAHVCHGRKQDRDAAAAPGSVAARALLQRQELPVGQPLPGTQAHPAAAAAAAVLPASVLPSPLPASVGKGAVKYRMRTPSGVTLAAAVEQQGTDFEVELGVPAAQLAPGERPMAVW